MKQIEIMLVEDDRGDIRLIREALRNSKVTHSLSVVYDGKEALNLLYEKIRKGVASLPSIILLDMNLPGKDGKQVLREVKSDDRLRHIPIIVFSTSDNEDDIRASYKLYANCYITKPADFDDYINAIAIIKQFWLNLVQLP